MIITKSGNVLKGVPNTFTLNLVELAALITAPEDAYYANTAHWKKVTVNYKSSVGNQLESMHFKPDLIPCVKNFLVSAFAFDYFAVQEVIITDFDGGTFTLPRSAIPTAASEFDVNLDLIPVLDFAYHLKANSFQFDHLASGEIVTSWLSEPNSTKVGYSPAIATVNGTPKKYIDPARNNGKPFIHMQKHSSDPVATYTGAGGFRTNQIINSGDCTIIAVYDAYLNPAPVVSTQKVIMTGTTTATLNIGERVAPNHNYISIRPSSEVFISQGNINYGMNLGVVKRESGVIQTSINNANFGSYSALPVTFGELWIGNNTGVTGSTGGAYGIVSELIVYDRALTAPELASVQSYLAAKYGVTLA